MQVYGNFIKKKIQYEQAYKQVIQPDATDRAGAVTNNEVFNSIDELKSLHSNLVGTEASWLRWANWIKKQPGHERENLMRSDPPSDKPNLFELFSLNTESDRIQEVRNNISIGRRVNESISTTLPRLETEIDQLIDIFRSGLSRIERLKTLLEGLKSQLASNENLMEGFNAALGPTEDEFARSLLNDIDNVEDIDHQVYE